MMQFQPASFLPDEGVWAVLVWFKYSEKMQI